LSSGRAYFVNAVGKAGIRLARARGLRGSDCWLFERRSRRWQFRRGNVRGQRGDRRDIERRYRDVERRHRDRHRWRRRLDRKRRLDGGAGGGTSSGPAGSVGGDWTNAVESVGLPSAAYYGVWGFAANDIWVGGFEHRDRSLQRLAVDAGRRPPRTRPSMRCGERTQTMPGPWARTTKPEFRSCCTVPAVLGTR